MIIYGASGHAKVIIDIIESTSHHAIDMILDDNPEIHSIMGKPVKHSMPEKGDDFSFVIAVGNNVVRKEIVDRNNFQYSEALVHNKAIVNRNVVIGEGSVVMAGAVINPSSKVGSHAIINTNAIIDHDVKVADFCHISPGAVITGNVKIAEGTQIGAGASILPGVNIGKWCTIGAGSVILKDIPDYAVVVGNPGRIIKYNKSEE
ncbi:acetyltransferase [Christiangramia aquimixticola]|uniref:acetyltransferase n=1 Tax=Christiangramia aquimixticola TaxID=1697558 RepID=UPI003AA96566